MHSPHHARWVSNPNAGHAQEEEPGEEAGGDKVSSRESSTDEEDEFLLISSRMKLAKTKEFHDINPQDLHLIRLISDGSNAFADVWEASCHMKPVAVKIPKDLAKYDVHSWRQEMEIMSRNWHPNIALYMGTCVKEEVFMIVMELLHSDLYKLLHHSQVELSFYTRMKMCKDIALGMNWLHKIEPAVVHRDLKTPNLLVEKLGTEYRVKVADFGISMMQTEVRTAEETEGGKPILGTILTTAPEIMDGSGSYNEKTDVYSFGLVMWEVATRQRLFASYLEKGSVSQFVHAICKEHKRPRIPEDILPDLRVLIEKCWHSNPSIRPNFEKINEELDQIIVKSAIRDAHGRSFWIKNFLKRDHVPWTEFASSFYDFLRLSIPNDPDPEFESGLVKYLYLDTEYLDEEEMHDPSTRKKERKKRNKKPAIGDDVLKLRCLRTLLVQKGYTKLRSSVAYTQDIVTIERFGEILDWFGPIVYRRRGSPSCFILDEMKSLLEKQWFFGDVSAQEAQSLLGNERGCFLVRFTSNPKYPGCFTVSRISASGQPSHIRIIKKDNRVSVADDKDFESLTHLVEQLGPVLRLEKPCPKPSKYWVIFKGGQEEEDDASDTSSLDSLSDDSEEEEAQAIVDAGVEHGWTKTPHA